MALKKTAASSKNEIGMFVKSQTKAIWTWGGAAFATGLVATFALTILALDFYVSFNAPSAIGSLGGAALLTMAGTWAWRNRDDRRPSLSRAALTAVFQAIAFTLGYLVTIGAFNCFYPPNFT
jgi:hypothetical protein